MTNPNALNITPNDFRREPGELVDYQLAAAERVLRSGYWILGEEVLGFEHEWANYCATGECVGVANGLDAIEIGLRALGIGPGDEVVTTPVTAFATTLAIQKTGARPVFADIDPTTGCISSESVSQCVSTSTKAVLAVHLYGRAADLDGLNSVCDDHGIHLVEDCAQAHGAIHRGRRVGSVGRFGAWSFYPTKNLGGIGDSGALTTSDSKLAKVARCLRNYGQSDRYHHDLPGMNSRLDELQAALLRVRLTWLDSWNSRRREIAERYRSGIKNPLLKALAAPVDPQSDVHHLYVLLTPHRDQVRSFLQLRGVPTLIHYPLPCNEQRALSTYRLDPSAFPHAQKHCARCFSLPIHPFLSDHEVNHVISMCNEIPESVVD